MSERVKQKSVETSSKLVKISFYIKNPWENIVSIIYHSKMLSKKINWIKFFRLFDIMSTCPYIYKGRE